MAPGLEEVGSQTWDLATTSLGDPEARHNTRWVMGSPCLILNYGALPLQVQGLVLKASLLFVLAIGKVLRTGFGPNSR